MYGMVLQWFHVAQMRNRPDEDTYSVPFQNQAPQRNFVCLLLHQFNLRQK